MAHKERAATVESMPTDLPILQGISDDHRDLDTYVARRRQRADWVQQQSRAVVETLLLPPAIRNAAFCERGDQGMHYRFEPLVPAP